MMINECKFGIPIESNTGPQMWILYGGSCHTKYKLFYLFSLMDNWVHLETLQCLFLFETFYVWPFFPELGPAAAARSLPSLW